MNSSRHQPNFSTIFAFISRVEFQCGEPDPETWDRFEAG